MWNLMHPAWCQRIVKVTVGGPTPNMPSWSQVDLWLGRPILKSLLVVNLSLQELGVSNNGCPILGTWGFAPLDFRWTNLCCWGLKPLSSFQCCLTVLQRQHFCTVFIGQGAQPKGDAVVGLSQAWSPTCVNSLPSFPSKYQIWWIYTTKVPRYILHKPYHTI